jgi:type II secretory pathway predicted ATPase ExeA
VGHQPPAPFRVRRLLVDRLRRIHPGDLPLLIIDEASLLRLDVFAELHTLTQFKGDSKPLLPIILAGQNNLVDSLLYRTSLPLSSRIVARSHLEGVSRKHMEAYLAHHLKIAGIQTLCSPRLRSRPSTRVPEGSSEEPTAWPVAP